MKKLNDIELHDGNLLGIHLDQEAQEVTIDIEYYSDSGSGEREKAQIKFTGVTQVNQILDLELMKKHSAFGNITQWVVGESPKVTQIYLARGLISVTSKTVELVQVV
ncbi:hypothetical protein PQS90_10925 [Pseudomonas sp. BLCC-B13]|uniref:hypothetical protein n=1 Tax=Pseudomonas sp. BLCC-B13 TaxID=3025314 RepID=UPI00234F8433|nr:hypothetical protein [Pseudomonas sp. BLCC-B13]MDC7825659.1 hypothetical protein [Pseudomonas sp. BLCC-B13]